MSAFGATKGASTPKVESTPATLTTAWEKAAKPGEQLTHARTKELWDATLDAREAADRPVNDPYGRRMVLHQLSEDLLAKTQPNLLVRDAARLPEDNEPWAAWVQDEDNQ